MKDFFRHNRLAAIAALIVVIALSLLIGVNRSVGKLADGVEAAYSDSDTGYGSVHKDVQKFCACLGELYSVTASAGFERPDYFTELKKLSERPFGDAMLLSQAYSDAVSAYNRFINAPGTDSDSAAEATRCFAEVKAMQLRIKHNDPYNNAAKEYNKALNSFPASVFDFIHSEAAVFD